MSENPLIGKQISLISKKNIRYLGTLYSINEQNATVALQNVRSFGTEGRPGQAVAASNDVHPFLVFRGQDITDLHVHEEAAEAATATTTDAAKAPAPAAPPVPSPPASAPAATPAPPQQEVSQNNKSNNNSNNNKGGKENEQGGRGGRGGRGGGRGRGRRGPRAAPGTGASLLNRPTRGAVAPNTESLKEDFDFQSNLKDFQDENDADGVDEEEDEAGDEQPHAYEKDDFFDSISCEASDRQAGVDNRLRGREERDLNTETFGAVALSSQRRRRGGRGGRGGGRGRGRGGGRGRGRGGRGGRGRFRQNEGMPRAQST